MNSHQRRIYKRLEDRVFETFKEAQILKFCEATGMTREQYFEMEKQSIINFMNHFLDKDEA